MHGIFQRLKPIHYTKVDFYVLTPCSHSCRIISNITSSLGDLAFWSGENSQMWPTKVVKKGCEISCFDLSPKNSFNVTISWFKGVYQTKVLSGLVSKAALIFFNSGSHFSGSITGSSPINFSIFGLWAIKILRSVSAGVVTYLRRTSLNLENRSVFRNPKRFI